MSDVTKILSAIQQGDPKATEELLPLVYAELRKLAAAKLLNENPGQTLQATALVHEAYLRLVDDTEVQWDSRGHFFAAAAEAMRRILVESARRKATLKRGGEFQRREVDGSPASEDDQTTVLQINDALEKLAETDSDAAELVKLLFFAGLTMTEAAQSLAVSPRKAQYLWAYARSWIPPRNARGLTSWRFFRLYFADLVSRIRIVFESPSTALVASWVRT